MNENFTRTLIAPQVKINQDQIIAFRSRVIKHKVYTVYYLDALKGMKRVFSFMYRMMQSDRPSLKIIFFFKNYNF